MTNNGFAAQLRQHLLESADERPADGQIAAIVDRVASTAQRRSLVGRLTWFPGRVGPFPSAAVRYGLVAAVVGATILGTVLVGGSEAPPTPDPLPSVIPSAMPGGCFDVPAGATYRNDVGPLSLTVTVPADAATRWESRGGTEFSLMGSCSEILSNSGPFIGASIVSYVDGTCETGGTAAIDNTAEAVAAVTDARGVAISQPASASLGGHAATRFEIAPDARICFPGVNLWSGFAVRGGEILYLIDVDGLPLGITVTGVPGANRVSAIAEAEAILASLRIDAIPGAQPSREPGPTPDPGCLQFDGTGTYAAPVGPLSVTATVPDDPATYWSGSRDWFGLSRSPCGFDAPLTFEAQLITRVAVDACRGLGDSVDVRTAAEAATALADQASTDATGRTDVTIDGNPAVRVQITVPSDLDTAYCDEGAALLLGQTVDDAFIRIDPGWTYTVHLVDFDGSILAVTSLHETADGAEDPDLRGQIDAIIGSLELRPLDGGGS